MATSQTPSSTVGTTPPAPVLPAELMEEMAAEPDTSVRPAKPLPPRSAPAAAAAPASPDAMADAQATPGEEILPEAAMSALDQDLAAGDQAPEWLPDMSADMAAQAVEEALLAGRDVSVDLAATAAGFGGGPGGEDGQHSFIRLGRVTEGTTGVGFAFPVETTVLPTTGERILLDDTPDAIDDNATVDEDSAGISGNVLPNDKVGGDGPARLVNWDSTSANYGTFTPQPDGSWTYVPSPALNALDVGEALTETFSYTMRDTDGDTDSATLTITITGSNDIPVITVDTGNEGNADDVVLEAALSVGSNPGSTGEFASGQLLLADPDGLDDLQSVTINGATVALGSLVGASFAGSAGTLTITAYDSATGVATYQYELTSVTTDVPDVPETDVFTLSVSDGTTSSAPADITIQIVDDLPAAMDDSNGIASENSITLTGNVLGNDAQGADGAAVTAGTFTGAYGSLALAADGSYTYTLNSSDPDFVALVGGATANETFTYTLTDGDGDVDTATLTLAIRNDDDGVLITNLTPSGEGGDARVDEDDLPAGSDTDKESLTTTGNFSIAAPDGVDDLSIGGHAVIANGTFSATSFATPLGNTLSITGYDPATGVVSYSYTLLDNEAHLDGSGENSLFEDFTIVLTDRDGDSASDTLSINIVDDVPANSADGALPSPLVLDETRPEGTETDGDSNPAGLASTSANFSGSFSVVTGADTPADISYSLVLNGSDVGSGLYALQAGDTSSGDSDGYGQGGEILLSVDGTGNVITGALDGVSYFTLTLDPDTGVITFTQLQNIWHSDSASDDDTATLTLASADLLQLVQTVVDADGDTTSAIRNLGADVFAIEDDGPQVSAITAIHGFNDGQPLTGYYDVDTGSDPVGNGADDGVILSGLSGTTADGRPITDATVQWTSEDDGSVTYTFSFMYYPGPDSTDADLQLATGTVTFDKLDGSYTFALDNPLSGQTTFSTSAPADTFNYDIAGNSSPEIVVQEYDGAFFGVLTSRSGPTSGSISGLGTTDANGGNADLVYTEGDLLENDFVNYMNVNTATVGVGDDVVHVDDLLNFDFYNGNPVVSSGGSHVVDAGAAGVDYAYADSINIVLDQVTSPGGVPTEDIAILLKLARRDDPDVTTTVLLIANSASDYALNADGYWVVTVGEDDYNSADYQIYGVQIVTSTDNLTGTGTSLSTHEDVTLTAAGDGLADTSDGDNIKIIQIDVNTSTTTTYDSNLTLSGAMVDGDGDSEPLAINIHLEAGGSTLTGSNGSDSLTGTSGADTLIGGDGDDILAGGAGNDMLTGGGGADIFAWNLGDAGSAGTPATDTVTDFSLAGNDALDLRDLLSGEESQPLTDYLHFTLEGADTVLNISSTGQFDGGYNAAVTDQRVVLTNIDLVSGHTDSEIIQSLVAASHLRTDA